MRVIKEFDPFNPPKGWVNPLDQMMELTLIRAAEVISRRSRFVIIYGPPGISKSENINALLVAFYIREKEKWEHFRDHPEELEKADEFTKAWFIRRTRYHGINLEGIDLEEEVVDDVEEKLTEKGVPMGQRLLAALKELANTPADKRQAILAKMMEFRPPFELMQGSVSHPEFYAKLWWTKEAGEVLFIDDVSSLRDSRVQSLLQQATDPTHSGSVQYNFRQEPVGADEGVQKRMQFQGSIIVVTNFRRGNTHDDKKLRALLPDALIDRAQHVDFSWDRNHLTEYVYRHAFKKGGLMRFLTSPSRETHPRLPENKQGLGWLIPKDGPEKAKKQAEAAKMLDDAEAFLKAYWRQFEIMSFRSVRKLLHDVRYNPKSWRQYAHAGLLSPERTSKKEKVRLALVERAEHEAAEQRATKPAKVIKLPTAKKAAGKKRATR